ncbi:kinase-like domain-containing protein [Aspergillus ambiguus]|uniref:kinase-like domain-containing protein n=1 Tax=Aspergillus ambiguus TaxID=176160 RepID=UPI003CCDA8E3
MDVSKRRKEPSGAARPHKVTKLPPHVPEIRPSNHGTLEDISFKWTSAGPWEHYQRETALQPGCYLAFLKKYPHTPVLVCERDIPCGEINQLRSIVHRNIVRLCRIYVCEKSLTMIYEMTFISLKDILSFRPHWNMAETAAVCQGVLVALNYIHKTLGISHGDIRAESICLDSEGAVKLGRIGDSLLQNKRDQADDIYAFARIVKRLIEPGELNESLADFMGRLERGEAPATLLQHKFLSYVNGPGQLHHCVWRWFATRALFT